ncbi:MAG: ABC transporter ATP-binding protein [Oscillospiraceae bacterium]
MGESGCGKTTLASAIVDALPNAASITDGKLLFRKENNEIVDLRALKRKELRPLLWEEISMVFQASQSSFNPVKKIRTQFIDTVQAHERGRSVSDILEKSRHLLGVVMLDADKVLNAYPHELSGGMKQRTLLALSLLLDPRLMILDEPTTALDLLTQEKILLLLNRLKQEFGFSLLFITHDLGIVSELADTVVTMYAGKVVECCPTKTFFEQPRHPYSKGLIDAIPRLSMDCAELCSIPGTPPDMIERMKGCPFAPRCSRCTARCTTEMPSMEIVGAGNHACACWNPVEGGAQVE